MNNDTPALAIQNATLSLGGRTLWKNLSLSVARGECIAVLGPNGSGKSSLLKAILGQYPMRGTVHIMGEPPKSGRQHVGYIPQQKSFDPHIPLRGRDLVEFGVNGTRWFFGTKKAEAERVSAAISSVGASRYAHKPLGQLSGGEQQRLRVAQAIVNSPPVLLCDEPLLSLDLASQQSVAALINKCRVEGTAVLFVTHEINPILPFVDRVLYLVGGRWAIGTPSEVLTSKNLTDLYGVPVEVLQVHGRIIVVSSSEHVATEPQDTHHHPHHDEADHD